MSTCNLSSTPDAGVRASTRRSFICFLFSFFALSLLLAAPHPASAHAHLKQAQPAVGSTVEHAPSRVILRFTEELESRFSTIVVRNAEGASAQVGKAKVSASDKAEMSVGLKRLKPGTYTVIWHALSVDTHRTHGSFKFTVAQ